MTLRDGDGQERLHAGSKLEWAGAAVWAGTLLLVLVSWAPLLAATPAECFEIPKAIFAAAGSVLALGIQGLAPVSHRLAPAGPSARSARVGLWSFAAFSAWSIVAAGASPVPWLALRPVTLTVALAAAYFTARRADRGIARRVVLLGIAVSVGALAASILVQAYAPAGWTSLIPGEAGRFPGGTLGNRNRAADVIVIAAPAVALAWGTARRRRGRFALEALFSAAVAVVVIARSRGAWLAALAELATAGLVYWTLPRTDRVRLLTGLPLGAAALAGIGVATFVPNHLQWGAGQSAVSSLLRLVDLRHGTGYGRLRSLQTGIRIIADAPLTGFGPGSWPVAYAAHADYGDPAVDPDAEWPTNSLPPSEWLGILVERGGPALAFLLVTAACLATEAHANARSSFAEGGSPVRARELAEYVALGAALAAIVVIGCTEPLLATPAGAYLCGAVLGVASGRVFRSTSHRRLSQRRSIATIASAVLLAAIAAYPNYQAAIQAAHLLDPPSLATYLELRAKYPFNYVFRVRAARLLVSAGRCASAREDIEFARHMFPMARSVRVLESQCMVYSIKRPAKALVPPQRHHAARAWKTQVAYKS